jgi:hypothetical protein
MRILTLLLVSVALLLSQSAKTVSPSELSDGKFLVNFDKAILAHIVFDAPLPISHLENGRCAVCRRLGLKSTVPIEGYCSCTTMYCSGGYYDEDGHAVRPTESCNTCTCTRTCSKWHVISELWNIGLVGGIML